MAARNATSKYPQVLSALKSAVSGYAGNFKEGESYASVKVNNLTDIAGFMNYLSSPGDSLKDVNSMGSWSIIPQETVPNNKEQAKAVVSTPKAQPPAKPQSPPKVAPAQIAQEAKSTPPRVFSRPVRPRAVSEQRQTLVNNLNQARRRYNQSRERALNAFGLNNRGSIISGGGIVSRGTGGVQSRNDVETPTNPRNNTNTIRPFGELRFR